MADEGSAREAMHVLRGVIRQPLEGGRVSAC
jgi:hypothetical protein